jgi:hypothetical protein
MRQFDACARTKQTNYCELPFEMLYASSPSVLGRLVAFDAVLVAGSRPDGQRVALLFESQEKARICNTRTAIELVGSSSELTEIADSLNGNIVNVAGRLAPGEGGHILQLELNREPSLIMRADPSIKCLQSSPILPEPNKAG